MVLARRRFARFGWIATGILWSASAIAQDGGPAANVVDAGMPQPADITATLPDAPSAGTGTIAGTIVDRDGEVIQDAQVQLSKKGAPGTFRQMKSNATGGFAFRGLEPNTYVITVSGKGMSTFASDPIPLLSDQPMTLPNIVLTVAGATTSVTVMDQQQASIEQVRIAEQQRVLKVFPNFYSSFDPNAPPILAKQKYGLATRSLIDPVTLLTTGLIAGVEQQRNVFSSFGGGIEGYGKRYGAAYAEHASSELLTRAIFPSIFHTDPRYFIMGEGGTRARTIHALTSTFVTRADNGGHKINFPEILGALSAGALSNAYFPEQERGVNLVLVNGLGGLAGNMADNLFREFLLNHITTRAKR